MNVKEHASRLLDIISKDLLEKEQIVALGLLCCVSGESLFLLGPPGTAKSMVARRLKEAFAGGTSFEYLMSRFSTPDEIFGPVSISKLKNEDRYERCVEGYLPSADIVFLDEIWKAGPSIQNTLLTAINERIFRNGQQVIDLPMKCLLAASNELPNEDEGLEALWDRFMVRVVSNCITKESTFCKMLRSQVADKVDVPANLLITDEIYAQWREQMRKVNIPKHILGAITYIRQQMNAQMSEDGENDLSPWAYYISDRRWKKAFGLLQASAFMNGRSEIDESDLVLLLHMLWNKTECISRVVDIVFDSVFWDVKKQTSALLKESLKGKNEGKSAMKANPADVSQFKVYKHFYARVLGYGMGDCYFHIHDYKYLDNKNKTQGMVYESQFLGANVISRLDLSTPFASTQMGQGSLNVSLRRIPGGLEIDGTPYVIEHIGSVVPLPQPKPCKDKNTVTILGEKSQGLVDRLEEVRKEMQRRADVVESGGNMFVSDADVALVKTRLTQVMKTLDETRVHMLNNSNLA